MKLFVISNQAYTDSTYPYASSWYINLYIYSTEKENSLIYYVTEEDVSSLEACVPSRTQGPFLGPVQFNLFINNHKENMKSLVLS